ncbi:MAG TPA: asparaginase [Actinomycetota bacterium]|nr:asparaginase [Actinomycetota bacterium]
MSDRSRRSGPVPLVRVLRSGLEEAVHLGSVAVTDAAGTLVARAGDPGRATFARSTMKPLQATVSLSLIGEDLTDREIAVMCASHNGEPVHVEAVAALLARARLGFDALRTPSMAPWDQEAALVAGRRAPEFSDCSGKHAGMLVACARQGWDLASYRDADHPIQRRVLAAVVSASGQREVAVGVDGCGVPVHWIPVRSLGALYARLGRPEALGELASFAARALQAMGREPYLVAGRGRVCTAVMEAVPGVVVKVGAEGLICAALTGDGLGVAVKITDGGARAAGPALLHTLDLLGAMPPGAAGALERWIHPPVLGGGEPRGHLEADFDLTFA